MPTVGELKLNPGRADFPDEGYRSRYNHATERATAGYYEVVLDDYKVKAQLTATSRVVYINILILQLTGVLFSI